MRAAEGFRVEPLVGLHSIAIERLWTSLKTGPYRAPYRRDIATVTAPLLPMAASSPPLLFENNRRDKDSIRRLIALYHNVGLGFARGIARHEALEPILRQRARTLAGNPERLAACLYLMGRVGEASAFVESFRSERPTYFEGFAAPFLALLGRRHDGA